jgi:hypothetical protein
MRRLPLLLFLTCALLWPAQAGADATLATLTRPAPISAHAGRVIWSTFDPVAGNYVLMTAARDTPVQRVPVRPRSVPFDVDLGPDAEGETVAAYSRCYRDPPRRRPSVGNALTQMPEWSAGRGCDLYQFNFATGRETRIAAANSPSASEFLPAVWKTRVAFARVYERRRGRLGDRAYLYTRAVTGVGRSRRVPAGNRSTARFCSGRPVRCRYTVEAGPTALDVAGRRLAFGRDSAEDVGPTSAVYLDTIGDRRTRRQTLSSLASGEIQAQELIQPAVDAGRVTWARVLFGDNTENGLRRYSIFNGVRERAVVPPPGASAFLQPVLAFSLDAGTHLYLLSGHRSAEPGCTPQSLCVSDPGCSDTAPCELRTATDVVFTRYGRATR